RRHMCELLHLCTLVADVVEVEQRRIFLAAVHAGVNGEIREQARSELARDYLASARCLVDLPLPVPSIPRLGISPLAGEADSKACLPLQRSKRKFVPRFHLATDLAGSLRRNRIEL